MGWTRLVLTASILVACDPPRPPMRYDSPRIAYYTDSPELSDEELAPFFAEFEARVAYLTDILEVDAPKLHYSYVPEAEDLDEYCGWPAGRRGSGCAYGTSLYSSNSVHVHEVVHGLSTALGNPPILFAEGLAQLLGNGSPLADPSIWAEGDLRGLMDYDFFIASGSVLERNLRAGAFAQFLIDSRGWRWFLDLYRDLPRDASNAAALLELRTGRSIAQLEEEWLAASEFGRESLEVANGFECGAFHPVIALDGVQQTITPIVRPGGNSGVAAITGGDSPSLVAFTNLGDERAHVSLFGCDHPRDRAFARVEPGETAWLPFSSGRGGAHVYGESGDAVVFSAELLPAMIGPRCEELVAADVPQSSERGVALGAEPYTSHLLAECDSERCVTWLRARVDGRLQLLMPNSFVAALRGEGFGLDVCSECDEGCETLSLTAMAMSFSSAIQVPRDEITGEVLLRFTFPASRLDNQGLANIYLADVE